MPPFNSSYSKATPAETLLTRLATLDERLDAPPAPTRTRHPSLAVAMRHWQQAYDARASGAFQRRLQWDRLDPDQLQDQLNASIEKAPSWWTDWQDLSEQISIGKPVAAAQLPFTELFARPAQVALDALDTELCSRLSVEARTALRDRLQHSLASVATASLYSAFRSNGAERHYSDFLHEQAADGLSHHVSQYPVVARRLVSVRQQWLQNSRQFLQHLADDWPALIKTFAIPAGGEVTAITTGLSERHDDGAQVCSITVTGGTSLVYKPRDVRLEKAWSGLLTWLQARDCTATPPAIEILAGQSHGWFYFVKGERAENAGDIARYAERAGGLICLAWLLNASDLHSENLIATPEGPCLIDAETICQPHAADTDRDGALHNARRTVKNSCLASGLLHFPFESGDGVIEDHSGLLGTPPEQLAARSEIVWQGLADQTPNPQAITRPATPTQHRLRDAQGRAIDLTQHLKHVVEGFRTMWQSVRAHQAELLADNGPIAAMRDCLTRVVMRPSQLYAQLQQQLLAEAKLQTHGALPGIMIDTINRHLTLNTDPPGLWPLVREERRQLEQLDIPVARASVDGQGLKLGTEQLDNWFAVSGWDLIAQRLQQLSCEGKREQQEQLLRQAMSPATDHVQTHSRRLPPRPTGGRDLLATMAEDIGTRILDAAIGGEDNHSLTWLAPTWLRNQDRDDRGASLYLYDGAAGIAVFLAALAQVSGKREFAKAAQRAMQPVIQAFQGPDTECLLRHEGLGICNGLGSLVMAGLHLYQLQGDAASLTLAKRVASHITPARIQQDKRLDLEGGSAGALLAITALWRQQTSETLQQQADTLARHLLARQTPASSGRAWPNHEQLQQTGLAHGAGGIAAALASYQAMAPAGLPVQQAIEDALAFENSLFDQATGNWALQRRGQNGDVEHASMSSWCYGAPGIALSRMMVAQNLPDFALAHEDLCQAMATTRQLGLGAVDHLCCGAGGIADVLLEYGRRYDQPADRALAERMLLTLGTRHLRQAAPYLLHTDPAHNEVLRPGLFRGLAGIGYTALRLLEPALAPVTMPGQLMNTKERAA